MNTFGIFYFKVNWTRKGMVETGSNMFLKAFPPLKTVFYLNCANHNFGRLVVFFVVVVFLKASFKCT